MNHNMDTINMKKIYVRNKDKCFFYYRQIKYRKKWFHLIRPFAGSKRNHPLDSSSLKPLTDSFHDLLHDITSSR